MKYLGFLLFALFSTLVLSCNKNIDCEKDLSTKEVTQITASFAGKETKTILAEDCQTVLWSPHDSISVFFNGDGMKFTAINSTPKDITVFSSSTTLLYGGTENSEKPYIYGVYPYSEKNSQDGETLTLQVPSVQTAIESSFAPGSFPSVARSKTLEMTFYNVCGGVLFTVSQPDILNITFSGNNNEVIAGIVDIKIDDSGKPYVYQVVEGQTTITINAPEGGFRPDSSYFFSVLPVKFQQGFNFSFYKSYCPGVLSVSSAVEIKRSVFAKLENVDKNAIFTPLEISTEESLDSLNNIYKSLNSSDGNNKWNKENGGLPAYILSFDLYAEDHVMESYGAGWFYYDYKFDTWSDYTNTTSRSYQLWNFCYTIINKANYIINSEPAMIGDKKTNQYILGQAYAVRSLLYWWLANAFCFNGGGAGDYRRGGKGVPVYTDYSLKKLSGKGRGTIQEVYDQIDFDIDKAIELLEASEQAQMQPNHIDILSAYGLKARASMTERDYARAFEYAKKAIDGGPAIADYTSGASAINDAYATNVLWAFTETTDEGEYSSDIFYHMDANCENTYSVARHLIGSWLYDNIPLGDGRFNWWTAPLDPWDWGNPGTTSGSKRSWCQKKLVFIYARAPLGHHILMRIEEMYLIAAEAACHCGDFQGARQYMKSLGEKRVANYGDRLMKFTDSSVYHETTDTPSTLMEEILLQRRIELWGEFPRIFDLQRLDRGFNRNWGDNSNHEELLNNINTAAGSPNFILHIPAAEFDSNPAMDKISDQNPEFEGW